MGCLPKKAPSSLNIFFYFAFARTVVCLQQKHKIQCFLKLNRSYVTTIHAYLLVVGFVMQVD